MNRVLGLGLSIVLGFVFIAATPQTATSGLSPKGQRGKILLQNRSYYWAADMYALSTYDGGNEVFFAATLPPRSKITISGVQQYRTYTVGADYTGDGTPDFEFDEYMDKKVWFYLYDL